MNARLKRYVLGSAAFHVGLVLFFVVASLIGRIRHKEEPHEIVTYFDVQASVPDLTSMQAVEKVEIPEPPTPEPPKDIPEPPKRKPIKKSEKRVKRPDTEKPPPKKSMSPEEVKKLLASGLKPAKTAGGPRSDFPFAWYLALVRQRMYEVWVQPSELAGAGLTAEVRIRVQADGRVSSREMVRASGNSVMDTSVMQAVRSVSRLEPLPNGFGGAYKDIVIEFELTGAVGI